VNEPIPDPALVVLVGASGSGKSTWARARYRSQEIVSSDELRGIVGSGPNDLAASVDAFRLLDQIVAGRAGRGLTTVVDTLGLDREKRLVYLDVAREAGLPAVAVVLDTPDRLSRSRNSERDRPVPAPVLTDQLRKAATVLDSLTDEGWVQVVRVGADELPGTATAEAPQAARPAATGDLVLQVSRFPWGEDPVGWLKDIALAAEQAGFGGIALMDHLIQIPQVERAWSPIPEPFTTLGMLAGLDTNLSMGTLCTPVTFRPAGTWPRRSPPSTYSPAAEPSAASGRVGGGASTRRSDCPSPPLPSGSTRWRPRSRPCGRCGLGARRRTTGNGSNCRRRPATRARWATSRSSSVAVAST
jgi:predicted kinase